MKTEQLKQCEAKVSVEKERLKAYHKQWVDAHPEPSRIAAQAFIDAIESKRNFHDFTHELLPALEQSIASFKESIGDEEYIIIVSDEENGSPKSSAYWLDIVKETGLIPTDIPIVKIYEGALFPDELHGKHVLYIDDHSISGSQAIEVSLDTQKALSPKNIHLCIPLVTEKAVSNITSRSKSKGIPVTLHFNKDHLVDVSPFDKDLELDSFVQFHNEAENYLVYLTPWKLIDGLSRQWDYQQNLITKDTDYRVDYLGPELFPQIIPPYKPREQISMVLRCSSFLSTHCLDSPLTKFKELVKNHDTQSAEFYSLAAESLKVAQEYLSLINSTVFDTRLPSKSIKKNHKSIEDAINEIQHIRAESIMQDRSANPRVEDITFLTHIYEQGWPEAGIDKDATKAAEISQLKCTGSGSKVSDTETEYTHQINSSADSSKQKNYRYKLP